MVRHERDTQVSDRLALLLQRQEVFIRNQLESGDPLPVGKFIIPEFLEYIKAGIEDIKVLEPVFMSLDSKHRYELYIFKCYIDNGKFALEKPQLENAFGIYKVARL